MKAKIGDYMVLIKPQGSSHEYQLFRREPSGWTEIEPVYVCDEENDPETVYDVFGKCVSTWDDFK